MRLWLIEARCRRTAVRAKPAPPVDSAARGPRLGTRAGAGGSPPAAAAGAIRDPRRRLAVAAARSGAGRGGAARRAAAPPVRAAAGGRARFAARIRRCAGWNGRRASPTKRNAASWPKPPARSSAIRPSPNCSARRRWPRRRSPRPLTMAESSPARSTACWSSRRGSGSSISRLARRCRARRADVPRAHLAQMAAYAEALRVIFPGRDVAAALLYTAGPRLVSLDRLSRA